MWGYHTAPSVMPFHQMIKALWITLPFNQFNHKGTQCLYISPQSKDIYLIFGVNFSRSSLKSVKVSSSLKAILFSFRSTPQNPFKCMLVLIVVDFFSSFFFKSKTTARPLVGLWFNKLHYSKDQRPHVDIRPNSI